MKNSVTAVRRRNPSDSAGEKAYKNGRAGSKALYPKILKRTVCAVACFVIAMLAAGAQVFPGTYPLGIALLSAVSGTGLLLPIFAGAVTGSAGIPGAGGAHVTVLILLVAVRLASSVWILSDRLPEWMKSGSGRRKMRRKLDAIEGAVHGRSPNDSYNGYSVPAKVFRRMLMMLGNFDGTMLRESVTVRMALSACAALFAGAWSVVRGGFRYYDLFGAVFSMLFTPLLTYFIYAALDRSMRTSPLREAGIYVLCAAAAYSLGYPAAGAAGTVTAAGGIFGTRFNMGMAAAYILSAVFSVEYGIYRGAAAGIACGSVLDIRFLPAYLLSAVVTKAVYSLDRTSDPHRRNGFGTSLGILSGGISAVAWSILKAGFDGLCMMLPPVAVGCALMIPLYRCNAVRLPENLFGGALPIGSSAEDIARLKTRELERRVTGITDSFDSVSAILFGMSERLSKPAIHEMREVCECAFEAYCADCGLRGKCGFCGGGDGRLISVMADGLMKEGSVSASAVPVKLASRCYNIGRIIDKINLDGGRVISEHSSGDRLAITASDFGLAGELLKTVMTEGNRMTEPDGELTRRLRRLISCGDFEAEAVEVYGGRIKSIYVRGIELSSTRLGGDDIQRLFENAAGVKLSRPEFTIDGSVLSMRMHSVTAYACTSGSASCAASDVQVYCSDKHDHGADCTENAPAIAVVTDTDTYNEAESEQESIKREVCGDVIISFEYDGKQYMIISDGMGSGREAAVTSGICVTVLRRLIESGAGLEASLKLLNSVIRSSGMECSATVDIAELDLITGEVRFIKSGAAPSFVLRGGSIFRLQSKTIPIGIMRALDAEMIRFEIEDGDRVIMVSDGAARSYEEAPWLLDLMTVDEAVVRGTPEAAAQRIVTEAIKRGGRDDVTCGVLCVYGRDFYS